MSAFFTPRGVDILFATTIPGVGRFTLRPLDPRGDIAHVYDWVTRDYARFWLMTDKTRDEVAAVYDSQVKSPHTLPLIGLFEGKPRFLVETYDPANDEVGEHYEPRRGDRGMHVLVAPATTPIAGFTQAVFRVVMAFMFSDADVERVVVEPDARNDKIHALNKRYGFRYEREIEMRAKRAALAFCTRDDFAASCAAGVPA